MSKEYNKELIKKYPWLTPTNRWSGKSIIDCANGEKGYWPGEPDKLPDYDYEYTELDNMPDGWRKAFGEKLCEEINNELLKLDEKTRKNFRITQIKEKFGSLRFYTNFTTKEIDKIISKYENKSLITCLICGHKAEWCSKEWIMPLCDNCAKYLLKKEEISDKDIEDYYDKINYNV